MTERGLCKEGGGPGHLFAENGADGTLFHTEHPTNLRNPRLVIIVQGLGEFPLQVRRERVGSRGSVFILADLADNQIQFIVRAENLVSDQTGNVPISFHTPGDQGKIVSRITEHPLAQIQIAKCGRGDIPVHDGVRCRIVNRVAVEQASFLVVGQIAVLPVLSEFRIRIEIEPVGTPGIGEWRAFRMDQVSVL